MSYYGFRPYVPAAKRRALAAREVEKLEKKGRVITPVTIEGRTIARNFWGKAWCENLERYSDFENRLPHGRTYVRNGSVVDLQIERGQVRAMVSGSEIYEVKIDIATVASSRWKAICTDCARSIGSLVELSESGARDHHARGAKGNASPRERVENPHRCSQGDVAKEECAPGRDDAGKGSFPA